MAFRYEKRTSERAKKTPGESYEAKGTPPAPGEGGGFKALETGLAKKGARTPGALAAWIGRRKYGKKRFQSMAAAGRKKG
jgi:hypothetical protein